MIFINSIKNILLYYYINGMSAISLGKHVKIKSVDTLKKPKVIDVTTVKCTLNSITKDPIFKNIIIDNVYRYNKIMLETIYLFNVFILYICNNDIKI
jgi:hypothetical protein